MSSGTRVDQRAGQNVIASTADRLGSFGGTTDDAMSRISRLGLSQRQQYLNRLWCYFTCNQYSARQTDWDGKRVVDHIEHEAVASQGYIPPGFYDAGGALLPLKFRRPTAPYHLVRVIVKRFTGLLFSQKRHPKFQIEGDPQSEDFVNTIGDEGRLWATAMQARTFGGAMGSVAMGFQFVNGRPVFEVHDPRWVQPVFEDRSTLKLKALDKRYIYPVEIRDETGEWIEVPMWYRRTIDQEKDVIYKAVPVGNGEEPVWEAEKTVAHSFGFCPAVWIQNMPVDGDIDGDPDCQGVYDLCESIDMLNSQAQRGTIYNCDPTLVITSESSMEQVSKGSGSAIKIPNGDAKYLEMTGGGITMARELSQDFRRMALEVAQCFLEGDSDVAQTATEIERRCSSMLAQADILREQYGERGLKPLINMAIDATKSLTVAKRVGVDIVRSSLNLPPRVTGIKDGVATTAPRKLGPGPHRVTIVWPRYFDPSQTDAQTAVSTAATAKTSSLVDDETAIRYIAEFFQIEDVGQLVENMRKMQAAQLAEFDASVFGGEKATEEATKVQPGAAGMEGIELTATTIGQVLTVNEVRSKIGFGPLELPSGERDPNGDLTVEEYSKRGTAAVDVSAEKAISEID